MAGCKSNFNGTNGSLALFSITKKIDSEITPIISGMIKPIKLSGSEPLLVIAIMKDTRATVIVTIPLISTLIFLPLLGGSREASSLIWATPPILAVSSTGRLHQVKNKSRAAVGAQMKNIVCQPGPATKYGPNTTPKAIPAEYADVTIL